MALAVANEAEILVGSKGKYSLLGRLKKDSINQCYRAHSGNKFVFIKYVDIDDEHFHGTWCNLKQEAAILGQLKNTLCTPILIDEYFDFEQGFIVLENLEGLTLADIISCSDTQNPITQKKKTVDLCNILSTVHRYGIIHNDVKPDNVISYNGELKLVDFGSAYPIGTKKRVMEATFEYMSPETFFGDPGTTESDVYSLGVMLYEILTDKLVPVFESAYDELHDLWLMRRRLIHPENLPQNWIEIISKATEFDPRTRYGTADKLAEDIKKL